MLHEISVEFVMGMALIFARFGAAFSQLPAIGSSYVFPRARLILSLCVCLLFYPLLHEHLPKFPMKTSTFLSCLVIEVMLGIVIALSAKICFAALDIVGSIISMQSGLGAAMFFDPNNNSQVSLISSMLMMIGYAAIFATDTHYVFIDGIVQSYNVFLVGVVPDMGDLSNFISMTINQSFILAFKMAAPFVAVSLGFLITNGILSRLMPNLQVFFVVTPVQILVMFGILFLVITNIIEKVTEAVRASAFMRSLV